MSEIKVFIREKRFALIALVLFVLLNIFLRGMFFPLTFASDAFQYLESAEWFLGGDVDAHPSRLLKPLAPMGVALLSIFTGNLVSAMVLEVWIMYGIFAFLSFLFLYSMFRHSRYALLGTFLLAGSYPMLKYGLDLFIETGAMAFYMLTLLSAWKYVQTGSRPWLMTGILSVAFGLLWKEYSVPAGFVLLFSILAHPFFGWREKLRDVVLYGAIAGGMFVIWQIFIFGIFQYTYLDWYVGNQAGTAEEREATLYHVGKSLFAVFLLGWVLAAAGLRRIWTLSPDVRNFLALLIFPSMMFFLWGYVSSRLYFIVAIPAVILAIHGAKWLKGRFGVPLWVSGGVVLAGNYAWLFLNDAFRALL